MQDIRKGIFRATEKKPKKKKLPDGRRGGHERSWKAGSIAEGLTSLGKKHHDRGGYRRHAERRTPGELLPRGVLTMGMSHDKKAGIK